MTADDIDRSRWVYRYTLQGRWWANYGSMLARCLLYGLTITIEGETYDPDDGDIAFARALYHGPRSQAWRRRQEEQARAEWRARVTRYYLPLYLGIVRDTDPL